MKQSTRFAVNSPPQASECKDSTFERWTHDDAHRRMRTHNFGRNARMGHHIIVCLILLGCSTNSDVLVGYNRGRATEGGASTLAQASSTEITAGASAVNTNVSGTGASTTVASGTGGAATSSVGVCANGGPSILLPTLDGCTSDLAKRLFLFAICSCSTISYTGTLVTDSLDVKTGSYSPNAGSVGANGAYEALSVTSKIGGSLWVRGDAQVAEEDIAGNLQCGGALTATGTSFVHENAYVAGDVDAPELAIDGALYVPVGRVARVLSTGAGTIRQAVAVAEPCECQTPFDVAAIASSFATQNDNIREDLASTALTDASGVFERTLPCGRYYFDSIGGTATIALHLTGRTVLAIGGSLSNSGGLSIELGESAELDLFVAGNWDLSGKVAIGRPSQPAKTRVYVGGRVAFSGDPTLYANWYVPNQPFVMSTRSELWGALHVQSMELSGDLTVHYDPTILNLPSCTPSGSGCTSCHDCANPTPACRDGTCTACQSDSDCCPPLHCTEGRCEFASILL